MGHRIALGQLLFLLPFASTLCYYCDGHSLSTVQRTRQGRKPNHDANGITSSPPVSPWLLQVNLMQYMKLSTSRDFRINASMLDSALQERNTEDVENEPDNDQVRRHLAAFTNSFPLF